MPTVIEIYTDGSFEPGSCLGGWAFVAYVDGQMLHEESGVFVGHTNNGFEILAVLRAMVWATSIFPETSILVWTDSRYVMQGFHRSLPIWRTNGWKTINPNPRARRRAIPDAGVWRELDRNIAGRADIRVDWCKAHSGGVANERADRLANAARLSHARLSTKEG